MRYEEYDFCMYWKDLPEEFREEKIDNIIKKKLENGDYDTMAATNPDGIYSVRPKLEEVLEDERIRQEIENWIIAHFPMYF